MSAGLPMSPEGRLAVHRALDACVHCGFCLPACPTYGVLGQEGDSPRGRLVLMRQLMDGALAQDDAEARDHLAGCLDCRACETACPSGVQYGGALEAVRGAIGPKGLPAAVRSGLSGWITKPRRLERLRGPLRLVQATGLTAGLAGRVLGDGAARTARGLPPLARRSARRVLPQVWPPEGESLGEVRLLLGCVMDLAFAPANWATAALARQAGFTVRVPAAQGCCGALSVHSGDVDAARRLARGMVDAMDGDGPVVVNAAGCATAMKEYGGLLAQDPAYAERAAHLARRVVDFTEWFCAHLPPPPEVPLGLAVAYDDPCHLIHGQGISEPPRAVLRHIGARLVPLADADRCCGSAGMYSLVRPEMSAALLQRKMAAVRDAVAAGAQVLATANPGCQMQLRQGVAEAALAVPVAHVAELAAVAYGLRPPAAMGDPGWPRP